MPSCDHNYVGKFEWTRIEGNNYDIQARWVVRRCKLCGVEERLLDDSWQIPHGDHEHTDQLTSPARFGT